MFGGISNLLNISISKHKLRTTVKLHTNPFVKNLQFVTLGKTVVL